MQAIILSIGDELMLGQTQDTNASWLSEQLATIGVPLLQRVTMGDDIDVIAQQLQQACSLADLVLVTGGLGPTDDDLTRHALAKVLDKPLKLDGKSLDNMKHFFEARHIKMPETNRIQAMIPATCKAIPNHQGTAPGIEAIVSNAENGKNHKKNNTTTHLYFMPGVPSEMKAMFSEYVATAISKLLQTSTNGIGGNIGDANDIDNNNVKITLCRKLHIFGTGESKIAEMLGDMMQRHRNPLVNSTPAHGIVSLRINACASDKQKAMSLIQPVEKKIRQLLGDLVFGADEDTLVTVVGKMLSKKRLTVTTAESCTGGLLAKNITDIPGASSYFRYGWVTYHNQAKTDLLGVSPQTLAQYGAVSEQVATQMATGALKRSGANFALTTTGIAGPDGGSDDKPVGLVYIALATKLPHQEQPQLQVQRNIFHGQREQIRNRTTNTALNMLRLQLMHNI